MPQPHQIHHVVGGFSRVGLSFHIAKYAKRFVLNDATLFTTFAVHIAFRFTRSAEYRTFVIQLVIKLLSLTLISISFKLPDIL